jgi:hypothetical protein
MFAALGNSTRGYELLALVGHARQAAKVRNLSCTEDQDTIHELTLKTQHGYTT